MSRPKGSKNKPKINVEASAHISQQATPSVTPAAENLYSLGGTASIQKMAGMNNVTQASSFFYSPELTTESWLLPKSRQEILKWCRIFFNLEPYVQSIITMHAMYPFSKFELTTDDDSVTQFYMDMAFNEKFNLFNFLLQASLSYNKFGEAIMFGTQGKNEEGLYIWEKFVLLEPELVEIKNDMFSEDMIFELLPTEELKSLVKSNKAEDLERKQELEKQAPEIIKAVTEGRNIRLNPKNCSIVARLTDPSATRGTSPIQALFKPLIYQDWVRLAQSAFAQRYVFPVELWTIGDLANNIMPDANTLADYKNLINQAIQNPPFSMVVPPIVKYEALSVSGKNFPVNNEYDYIQDQILIGLGVNKNIILGEGPSFSNVKTMALHKLTMIYKVVREQFEEWMLYKFFKPIAEANKFYTTVKGKRKLILPQISWYKSLDIEEEESERKQFLEMHAAGYLSTETLYSKFPAIDYDAEQKKLELEIGTVWDHGDKRLPAKIQKSVLSPSSSPSSGSPGAITGPEPIEPIEPGAEDVEEIPGKEPAVTEAPETTPTEEAPANITPAAPPAGTSSEAPTTAPVTE